MRTYPDLRMKPLVELAELAGRQWSDHEYDEALASFRRLEGELARLGLQSGWVQWGIATCFDAKGDLLMAFDLIQKAFDADPLNPSTQRSFDLIAGRLREALLRSPAADAAVARMYGLLQQAGESDVPCHLAMARHLASTGRLEEAARLAEAVTLTSPASRDAWLLRAELAAQRGQPLEAVAHQAEALLRERAEVPRGVPGPRKGA